MFKENLFKSFYSDHHKVNTRHSNIFFLYWHYLASTSPREKRTNFITSHMFSNVKISFSGLSIFMFNILAQRFLVRVIQHFSKRLVSFGFVGTSLQCSEIRWLCYCPVWTGAWVKIWKQQSGDQILRDASKNVQTKVGFCKKATGALVAAGFKHVIQETKLHLTT